MLAYRSIKQLTKKRDDAGSRAKAAREDCFCLRSRSCAAGDVQFHIGAPIHSHYEHSLHWNKTKVCSRQAPPACCKAMAQRVWFDGPQRLRHARKQVGTNIHCERGSGWRRGWDSNPRYAHTHNGFRDRPDRPLWHLSVTRGGAPYKHHPSPRNSLRRRRRARGGQTLDMPPLRKLPHPGRTRGTTPRQSRWRKPSRRGKLYKGAQSP